MSLRTGHVFNIAYSIVDIGTAVNYQCVLKWVDENIGF